MEFLCYGREIINYIIANHLLNSTVDFVYANVHVLILATIGVLLHYLSGSNNEYFLKYTRLNTAPFKLDKPVIKSTVPHFIHATRRRHHHTLLHPLEG